jgi:hypothetical protein
MEGPPDALEGPVDQWNKYILWRLSLDGQVIQADIDSGQRQASQFLNQSYGLQRLNQDTHATSTSDLVEN